VCLYVQKYVKITLIIRICFEILVIKVHVMFTIKFKDFLN